MFITVRDFRIACCCRLFFVFLFFTAPQLHYAGLRLPRVDDGVYTRLCALPCTVIPFGSNLFIGVGGGGDGGQARGISNEREPLPGEY